MESNKINDIEVKDFIELSPSVEDQRQMRIQEAKELLKKEGYFVYNLWHVSDVTVHYECSEQMAQSILEDALTNDGTMERIWFSIDYLATERKLKSKK